MSASPPNKLFEEKAPPDLTVYLQIKLGNGADPMTGVFFPTGYQARDEINLILYLHGWKTEGSGNADLTDKAADKIWKVKRFQMREDLNATKKNVVLVLPTLGNKSQYGTLVDDFTSFLDQVKAGIVAYGPKSKSSGDDYKPSWGKVVLACHSGSGPTMLQLAEKMIRPAKDGKGGDLGTLVECWGYDFLVNTTEGSLDIPPGPRSDVRRWLAWAKGTTRKLRVYWHSYKGQSASLDWLAKRTDGTDRVIVYPELYQKAEPGKEPQKIANPLPTPEHNLVPKAYFKDNVDASPFPEK